MLSTAIALKLVECPHASSQAHRSDEGQLVHRPLLVVALHASQAKYLREFVGFFNWSQGLLLNVLACGLLVILAAVWSTSLAPELLVQLGEHLALQPEPLVPLVVVPTLTPVFARHAELCLGHLALHIDAHPVDLVVALV
eukprot:CAMPEP_0203849456 /NCGR_PEP_ID=MMETSP0359-20131031/6204_1 /ASSEMBLY_ACC=CAM_ASM_000338 /TAXON_ID=268821 /ORGANISM="Scrippsiella Hangoei, Strain SHTV-5" /LENGTH=139 /DNA_ID=CAMNT_0050765221 /DNA_START=73 /DNA_END=493 /DNA_ORIENTATION=+